MYIYIIIIIYIYTIVLIVYDRSEFQDGSIINIFYVPELSHCYNFPCVQNRKFLLILL